MGQAGPSSRQLHPGRPPAIQMVRHRASPDRTGVWRQQQLGTSADKVYSERSLLPGVMSAAAARVVAGCRRGHIRMAWRAVVLPREGKAE